MTNMTRKPIPLAEAKSRLSELVVRAAFGGEEFVITRRGRPAAVLAPASPSRDRADLADARGWLAKGDPLFRSLAEVRALSRKRGPRALRRT